MKKIASILASLWLAACSIVGAGNTPEPKYQVLAKQGEFEIRSYPPLLLAETVVTGDYRNAGSIAFKRLAAYIFGANTSNQKMAMTTPVLREANSEKIAMTAPVLQQPEGQEWRMTFIMPEGYRLETLPRPNDPGVVLKEQAARKVAVLSYKGSLDEKAIADHSQQLLNWLRQQSLKPLSAPRSAAYDPPWTLPMFRRNEIQVDIE